MKPITRYHLDRVRRHKELVYPFLALVMSLASLLYAQATQDVEHISTPLENVETNTNTIVTIVETNPIILLLRDPSAIMRMKGAEAAATHLDTNAINQLLITAHDRVWFVREKAAMALGMLGDPRGSEKLVSLLGDEFADNRDAAIIALGRLKEPGAVKPMLPLLKDKYPRIRTHAAEALHQITGENFGENYRAWKRWWKAHQADYPPIETLPYRPPKVAPRRPRSRSKKFGI